LKLLIGGSSSFFFHLKEFSDTLNKLGVESKLVFDVDYSDGFPSRKIRNWFQTSKKFTKLIDDFKPDAIFVDRQRHFGIAALKANIPLFVFLRGNYWYEMYWNKTTIYKSFPKRIALWQWDKMAKEIFSGATAILPICKHLEKITNKHLPDKTINVSYEGINPLHWYHVEGMKLKHPCIGLLQDSNWWGKAHEMLILKKVLERMPNVHFYWAGDGPLRERVLSELNKYDNFHWLGRLQYPHKVREYLSEIDVYALVTGMDLASLSLKEAQLMKKPVVATNIGGNPEMMVDRKTGFLVEKDNPEHLIEKLTLLLEDKKLGKKMGNDGHQFVKETFNLEVIAKNFIKIAESHLKRKQ
jgi:glycosyltransferase involved in cell wall biosynthesis